jgi:polyisoprenoid-binding protein YceI
MTTQRWNIDTAHSAVTFTIRHMVISKVRGAFTRWEGAIDFDPENPAASRATAKIDAASIDTHEAKRDAHLRSADFFDAESRPHLTFESTSIEKVAADRYRVKGALTIRNTRREVELEAEYLGQGKDPWGNARIAFQAKTTINRKDFGLTWNQALEAGGVLVGEEVEVNVEIEAVKAAADRSAEKAA